MCTRVQLAVEAVASQCLEVITPAENPDDNIWP
jgi:hypothetical protein